MRPSTQQMFSAMRTAWVCKSPEAEARGIKASDLTDEQKLGLLFRYLIRVAYVNGRFVSEPCGIIDRPGGGYLVVVPPTEERDAWNPPILRLPCEDSFT